MWFYRNKSLAVGMYVFLSSGGWQNEKGRAVTVLKLQHIPLGWTVIIIL